MPTLKAIREDLKEIRYYYARKSTFDEAFTLTGKMCEISNKANLYNTAIQKATPRLFDIYYSLYIKNNTQESLSEKLGYSSQYIQKLNDQLVRFLQKELA